MTKPTFWQCGHLYAVELVGRQFNPKVVDAKLTPLTKRAPLPAGIVMPLARERITF